MMFYGVFVMNNDAVLQLVENDNPSVIYEGKRLYGFLTARTCKP